MTERFNAGQFRAKINDALVHVRRILDIRGGTPVAFEQRSDHQWADKFALVDCLSNVAITALLTSFEQLGLGPERLGVALGWRGNKQSVSMRLVSEESCQLVRQADRKVDSDEFIYENYYVTHTSKTVTTVHEWFWQFRVSYRLVLFAGADPDCAELSLPLLAGQSGAEIVTRSETPPYPELAVTVDESVNLSALFDQVAVHELSSSSPPGFAVRFAINTEDSASCRTPRRNEQVQSLLDALDALLHFAQRGATYVRRLASLERSIWTPPAPRLNQLITVRCHEHQLKRNTADDGWRCDGTANAGGCLSGITDFHQTARMERFRCVTCDYDLCVKCLHANRTDYRVPANIDRLCAGDTLFNPVVPLCEESSSRLAVAPSSSSSAAAYTLAYDYEAPLLSRSVLAALLGEHAASLQRAAQVLAGEPSGRLCNQSELLVLLVLQHVGQLIGHYCDGVQSVEAQLYAQLGRALGRQITAADFAGFMRWHNAKFFRAAYQLSPFSFAVRRPGHSPEGVVSIEQTRDRLPVLTARRSSLHGNAAMHFAINAATRVSFRGERHVHAWTAHRFDSEPSEQLQLTARARQFSSFVLLVGKIASARTFQPSGAVIVQNGAEVDVPLELEPLPTPKEFRDAIVSLSPDQQAFAKAFRAMQLESSLFALLTVDLKPQLELLLRLPAGSLTKEIQLAHDLQDMFIQYQIPSDLLTYDGPDDASAADKIRLVKAYADAVRAMIDEERRRILAEEEERRIAADLQLQREMHEQMQVRVQQQQRVLSAPGGRGRGRGAGGGPVAMSRGGAAPRSSAVRRDSAAPVMECSGEAAPMPATECAAAQADSPAAAAASSTPTPTPPSGKADAQHDEGDVVDYTKLPGQLDAKFSALDADNCLRTTTVKPSQAWTLRAQATLLSRGAAQQLSADGIKTETNKAFDLLDFLTRSGSITLQHASLHVFMAATHCFDKSLIDSLVQDNINPIDKLERSLLILGSTVHDRPVADLIKPQHVGRVSAQHPQLF